MLTRGGWRSLAVAAGVACSTSGCAVIVVTPAFDGRDGEEDCDQDVFDHAPQPEVTGAFVRKEALVVAHPPQSAVQRSLHFTVENLSREWLTVDRDAVVATTEAGRILHRIGAVGRQRFELAPGEQHDVNVRFDLDDLPRGQRVAVAFDEAVTIGGRHVGLGPIPFDIK